MTLPECCTAKASSQLQQIAQLLERKYSMFRNSLKVGITLAVLALATTAFAATLQFNSTGPYQYLGEPSFPYHMTLDGKAIDAMCINNNLWVAQGETWQVTVENVTTSLEQQAAWLFLQSGDGSNPDYQGAVWYLFNNASSLTPGAQALVTLAGAQTFTANEFANVHLYVPTGDQTGWTNGQPQTFIGSTPEPGTLLTLGSGIIGLAGLVRKRLFN